MQSFFLGSCRYMYGYTWNFFPARLHSTKEILYFLENINRIKDVLKENPNACIFGGMCNPDVRSSVEKFAEAPPDFKKVNKLILEICTRKVCYYNTIPVSHYYYSAHFKGEEICDEEIERDIARILELSKKVFHPSCEVHVIPHLNLKSQVLSAKIPERNALARVLYWACLKYGAAFHDIATHLEHMYSGEDTTLETYMADSTHYSFGYERVKLFLEKRIY